LQLSVQEQKPFLSFRNVNVMRGERVILQDIHLEMRRGERIAILGPNGCGKSTLIKAMTCEIYPLVQPGLHVEIFGRQRWDLTELKRKLGVVTSEAPGKAARHTTAFDAVLTGFFSSATLWPNLVVTEPMRELATAAMKHVGAEAFAQQELGTLSAGQQKRVMIARALVGSGDTPEERMLLMDEPSNALDIAAQAELRNTMRSLVQQGTGLILVTHHIADIIPEIDRVLMMRDGRIVGDGSRDEMITEQRLYDLFGVRVTVKEKDGYLHAW
jgi:iron complex transport system ATP-binding protein